MPESGTRNRILLALPEAQRAGILADAELVDLPKKKLLYEINEPIRDVYFIEEGVSSILSVLSDGTAVETSTCGREGMVGLPVFLGADRASTQAMQQIPGRGLRVAVADFRKHLAASQELRELLGRFAQAMLTLIAQNSACNRRHSIEERCVRWFLLSHDQMERDTFELTHQFLSQMLGVRRATVTVTAGAFQQAGLIKYHRGVLTIVNREGLEDIACECYAIIRNEYARLLGGSLIDDPLEKVETSDGKFSTVADGA